MDMVLGDWEREAPRRGSLHVTGKPIGSVISFHLPQGFGEVWNQSDTSSQAAQSERLEAERKRIRSRREKEKEKNRVESKKAEEGGTAGRRRRMLMEDEDAEDKRGGAERTNRRWGTRGRKTRIMMKRPRSREELEEGERKRMYRSEKQDTNRWSWKGSTCVIGHHLWHIADLESSIPPPPPSWWAANWQIVTAPSVTWKYRQT